MIAIDRLKFRYPNSEFLLDIPSLTIEDGEKVAIVGPSGCGKTTLLNLVSGIEVPDSGEVVVIGQSVSSMTDAQRRDFRARSIGMVFQQFELVEYINAKENILLPFAINSSLNLDAEVKSRVMQLANAVGIGEQLKRRSTQLSQGERQRVAICRAMITCPKIVMADEPTGNLDPRNKRLILELLFEQANRNRQTLLVVTHDMGILEGFDRVIDFEKFRLVDSGGSSSQVAGLQGRVEGEVS